MTSPDDGGDSPPRALLLAVVAMAGVALLVGLAIGGAVVSVAGFSGLDASNGDTGGGEGAETLVMPKYKPTETVEADLGLPTPSPTQSETPSPSAEPSPRTDRIKLFVAPQAVGPGERINFNGVYVDGEGVALQVQRKEGDTWTDFPVTATVRGGVYSTWIQTTRTGEAKFRMFDGTANRASNAVTVTIG